jgi:hypothetical protein
VTATTAALFVNEIEYRKLEVTFRNLVGEKPDAVGTV